MKLLTPANIPFVTLPSRFVTFYIFPTVYVVILSSKIILMNRSLLQLENYRPAGILQKFELWLATGLYLLGTIATMSEEPTQEGSLWGIQFLYDLLLISAFYFSFLLLNFVVLPRLKQKDAMWLNLGIIAVIIGVSIALFPDFEYNILLFSLTVYFTARFFLIFIWNRFKVFREEKGSFFTIIFLAGIFYLLFMFSLFAGGAEETAMAVPGLVLPFAIFLYIYSYKKLLPVAVKKKHPFRNYLIRVFLILFASAVPLVLLSLLLLPGDDEAAFVVNVFNVFFQFLITVPVSWFTWKRHMRGKEELTTLKKELGQSTAKFDFLRSQINPHFLFNALNTLYGTAIQENAERTGEGIQQLGDMMRFMLHENMQEKISLAREIEYLENYINLQRLRTDPSPNVQIQAEIQEQHGYSQISPMLLIPFVENAFKHGISLREPSHIKIALEKREEILYFDVYNSKHLKKDNDPEKDKSGIGLTNVKQRLELLYPGRHDLSIRETSKEFFVHLTLQLS